MLILSTCDGIDVVKQLETMDLLQKFSVAKLSGGGTLDGKRVV